VITGKTSLQIRVKWIEIAGRLCQECNPRHGDLIRALWRKQWRDAWDALEADRVVNGLWNEMLINQAWNDITADGTLLGALPMDPRGDVHVTETWGWTRRERQRFLVLAVDGDDLAYTERGDYERDGNPHFGPLWGIDYANDLGLSAGTLAEIDDPTFAFNPRYNQRVSLTQFTDQRTTAAKRAS
jgi:hypothetical protein